MSQKFIKTKSQHTFFSLLHVKKWELIIYVLSPIFTLNERASNTKVFVTLREKFLGLLNFREKFRKQGSRKLILPDLPSAWMLLSHWKSPVAHWSIGIFHEGSTPFPLEWKVGSVLSWLPWKPLTPRMWCRTFSAEREKKNFHCKVLFSRVVSQRDGKCWVWGRNGSKTILWFEITFSPINHGSTAWF